MKAESIDTKLRERGRKRLENSISNSVSSLMQPKSWSDKLPELFIKDRNGDYVPASWGDAIRAIKTLLLEEWTPEAEQREVNDFMERVESLESQVQDLYAEL